MSDQSGLGETLMANGVTTPFGVCRNVPFTQSFAQGQRVLLRGRSGAGKSVLLATLGLLQSPRTGSISICGHRVDSKRLAARVRASYLGYVFQEALMVDHLSIDKNLLLMAGQAAPAARELLDEWNIPWRDAFPATLSAGERQRVAVSAAIAKAPAVVIADEPTSSLDAVNERRVLAAFQSLPPLSTTIIASHDTVWLEWADTIIDLDEIASIA